MDCIECVPGVRVRVDLNGSDRWYTGVVVDPPIDQLAWATQRGQGGRYRWVRRDDTGALVMWEPDSLTELS